MTDRSNRTKFRNQILKPLMEAEWLEMTIPDKPRSSKQQYPPDGQGLGATGASEAGRLNLSPYAEDNLVHPTTTGRLQRRLGRQSVHATVIKA
ncbi:MAG: hypothetical protein OXC13_17070 [Caldilineaceae bacterium]|nr:hypothetical protein [Caldilineaceae bacterium]